MPTVADIASFLEEKIPPSLKEDYDNVGLLCGFPEQDVRRILVVLDITLDTIGEAREMGAELIVSHHPIIFTPLRQVLYDRPDGRRLIELLRADLSAICMHTNLDRLAGGVNTALAAALGGVETQMLPDMGCICRLEEPADLMDFLAVTREALQAPDMRYSSADKPVSRIALCGGAGGDILYDAARRGCDTVITGEVKHHQWIDGAELGLNLIEGGHFATENVVVPVLAEMLRLKYPDIDVRLSCRQKSPSRGFLF